MSKLMATMPVARDVRTGDILLVHSKSLADLLRGPPYKVDPSVKIITLKAFKQMLDWEEAVITIDGFEYVINDIDDGKRYLMLALRPKD